MGGRTEIVDRKEPAGGEQGWLRHMARVFVAPLAATAFLTVVPVPVPPRRAGMGWAVACFPLVGATMGALLALADRLLLSWLPSSVVAALLLAALLAMTGALHFDALMDSFDGLFGGRDTASRLSIMRDSRVGSYGVAAAGSVLLIEYGSLAAMSAEGRAVALVLALTMSRWGVAVPLWAFPAAASSGLAAGLKPEVRWPQIAIATATAVAIGVALAGWSGLGILMAAGVLVLLGGRFVVARLGGVTGDACGALGQLVEAATLVAWVAVR